MCAGLVCVGARYVRVFCGVLVARCNPRAVDRSRSREAALLRSARVRRESLPATGIAEEIEPYAAEAATWLEAAKTGGVEAYGEAQIESDETASRAADTYFAWLADNCP